MSFHLVQEAPQEEQNAEAQSWAQGRAQKVKGELKDMSEAPISPQEGVRNVARTAHNLATRGVGLAGDTLATAHLLLGKALPEKRKAQGWTPYEEHWMGNVIPTTQRLREWTQGSTGEYLKPHTKAEEMADSIIEDAAMMAVPIGKFSTMAKALPALHYAKALGTAVGASLGGELVESMTGNKTHGEIARAGLLVVGSLIHHGSVGKKIEETYKEVEATLPKRATIPAAALRQSLTDLKNNIRKGRPGIGPGESELYVLQRIKEGEALIKNGRVRVESLWAQKKTLNKQLGSEEIYKMGGAGTKDVKAKAKLLNAYYNKALDEYGGQNPGWRKMLKEVDEAHGAIEQSKLISRAAKKFLGKENFITNGLLGLFGHGALGGATSAAYKLGVAGTGAATHATGAGLVAGAVGGAAYFTGRLLYRIGKSHYLRTLYAKALSAAAKQDATSLTKYAAQLDKDLSNHQDKLPFQFVSAR